MPVDHSCADSPEDHSRVISSDAAAGTRLQWFFVWRTRALFRNATSQSASS
jgi:hypothetical protein